MIDTMIVITDSNYHPHERFFVSDEALKGYLAALNDMTDLGRPHSWVVKTSTPPKVIG